MFPCIFCFILLINIVASYGDIVSDVVNSNYISNDTENATQSPDPYFLPDGNIYRDVITIEAAKSVGSYAKQFKPNVTRPHTIQGSIKIPDFVRIRNFTYGERKPDDEIFDFVDSRFLNPPTENRQNRPLAPSQSIAALASLSILTQEQPSMVSSHCSGSSRGSQPSLCFNSQSGLYH